MKKPCRKSGKRKYDTHEQAANGAGEILTRGAFNSKYIRATELWTYKCPHCEKWHLTSKYPNPLLTFNN